MLERTFVHIPGVWYLTEQRLWQAGVSGWARACECAEPPGGFSQSRWTEVRDHCLASGERLAAREHRHFAQRLASRDHWRAYPDFKDRCAFLDIETTGMEGWAQVTVVGIYDGHRVKQFVAGENLDELPEELSRYALLVTFNGASFDLPFLRRAFRGLELEQLHVDLRFLLARLGHKGGLKAIERKLGLEREGEIASLDGFDAVLLWEAYQGGDERSRDLLLRYNAADVENLEVLMDLAYQKCWRQTADPGGPARA
jgi:uncharacterized protein